MANVTAQRCFIQRAPLSGPPLIQNGHLILQTHDIGWIVAGIFTIVATVVSFWLINKHFMWYTKKRQQRYIVRLLLMVPIYAIVSLASYIFWNHAIPLTLLRDSYESFVLYSFFYLLLQYLSPTIEGQKEMFRNIVLNKWIFPLGSVKYRPRDGLYFLQLMKWGVLQYCVVRPTTTLAAVILDFIGLYCDNSWSPSWGHIYITTIVSLSVTIAMYCLFQLYIPIAEQLAPQKPLLKLFSVKAVVFLTFWQATALSVITMFGVVKDTPYMTANDINTGIAAILETLEMMCFAVLHIRAFSYLSYIPDGQKPSDRTPRLRSFIHALDIRDLWRELRDGSVYMGKSIRGVEVDEGARRRIHFAKAMGREREFSEPTGGVKESWPVDKYIYDEELLLDRPAWESYDGRDLWFSETGASDDELRRKHCIQELAREDGLLHKPTFDDVDQCHTRGNNSWWKAIYDRISQSGSDIGQEARLSPIPQKPSQQHRRHRHHSSRMPSLDSPPPSPSVIYEYSSLDNGYSRVRLSLSHKERFTTSLNQPPDHSVGQNPSSYANHDAIEDMTLPTRARGLTASRPLPIHHSNQPEIPVSSKQTRSSAVSVPQNDQEGSLYVFSGIIRSDSLFARIFPNSTPATVEGHASSGGRTDPTSSQTTHSSPMTFPVPLPRTPLKHVSPRRPRDSQKHSPQRHRSSRPPIVLPTPLSPARYSSVEVPSRVPEQSSSSSVGRHFSRKPRRAGRHNPSSRQFSGFNSATSTPLECLDSIHSETRETVAARPHSNYIESASLGEPLALTPSSALNIDPLTINDVITVGTRNYQSSISAQSSAVDDVNVTPSRGMAEVPRLLPSSMRTTSLSTTSQGFPKSSRQLRHTRGDVGAARKSLL